MSAASADCVFCREDGGQVLWRDAFARVIVPGDPDHPGLCRVILNAHVREMTDLDDAGRARLMRIVFAVESAQRALLRPDKINLASLGNQVAHLHWHVIPRFADDPHFPGATFGARGGGAAHPVPADYADRLSSALTMRLA